MIAEALLSPTPWHDAEVEWDVLGAAASSRRAAVLVHDLVPVQDVYDGRLRAAIQFAVNLSEHPEVDTSSFDGPVGPCLEVDDRLLVGDEVARVVAVAAACHLSLLDVARSVVDLPCNPCAACVGEFGFRVQQIARLRRTMGGLRAAEERIADDPSLLDALDRWLEDSPILFRRVA
jgi:hypothetical protein